LSENERHILSKKFRFYHRLNNKQKKRFEHRTASFIKSKEFIGREEIEITDEIKVLIGATAVMLTFGFRSYNIDLIDAIIVYPSVFYSQVNEQHHKGEFNPKLGALVLSWEHFKLGYHIDSDNLNLGIHEFAHAIHLNSIKANDISATIFLESFNQLARLLYENEDLKETLITSQYFRDYAFTNQFEFVAVIIETFIETPQKFRSQFPQLYRKTKEMLNFNFAGY
jgi:Mlc titration factor MtfA (ptsG expression regulator)